MFVSPCRWWAQWRQGLSLALPPVLSQTAWDPWKWFCNLHGYSSPSRESQIEEAGNSGLGFGDALRWGGSEGRQLDTCILRVSFFLLAGNMTHVRQVSDGHVRITELVLEKNEPPPPKKKKIGKTVNLRRHWEGTQWNCRVVSSVRVWVYISLWRGGGREWFYFLPGGGLCRQSRDSSNTWCLQLRSENTPHAGNSPGQCSLLPSWVSAADPVNHPCSRCRDS